MHEHIKGLVAAGLQADNFGEWDEWASRCRVFLEGVFGGEVASAFQALQEDRPQGHWTSCRGAQVGYLEGLLTKLPPDIPAGHSSLGRTAAAFDPKRVFVVHGHDSALKEATARFLERIGLTPVVLHEQPNAGRTIIEKLEAFSNTGFAVVLLSPDDPVTTETSSIFRARQNVVLELGYFIGLLGRPRVCALHKATVELPSDLHGVLYVPFDEAGGWRTKLAQELVEAGYSINLTALLGG